MVAAGGDLVMEKGRNENDDDDDGGGGSERNWELEITFWGK